MNPEVLELLDLVYDCYPNEPDWAAVKTRAYQTEAPTELIADLCRAMWLYSEDSAAFDTLIWSARQ